MLYYTETNCFLGTLRLVSDGVNLNGIYFCEQKNLPKDTNCIKKDNLDIFISTKLQLENYFNGSLKDFDLPIKFYGSKFQELVWKELTNIPYGQTISYLELAKRIENPKASRAVGLANSKNPISIIVPCHRVIGKNGTLTGYASGLEKKKELLELEKKYSL